MGSGISSFTDDQARARFLAAYERAMEFWPRPREERDVPTRFGTTRVYGYGNAEGVPLVLLPGANATPAVWASSVAAFAEDRPVLAVDRVGEPGRSTQTAPIRSAEATADWLEEVLAGLGVDRVHLAGISYGAWVALNQAVRLPDRIVSLTLAEPAQALAPLKPGFLLSAVAAMVSGSEDFRRRWFGKIVGDTGESPECAEAQARLVVEAMRGFRGRLLPPRKVGDDELRSVTAPVLVLLGGASRAIDARRAEARARLLPNARTEVVPGAGHAIPVSVLNSRVPAFVRDAETGR
ncbi:alpha/beta fold hydrolase [Streptomyces sp. XD-27]|uniref:alpha/beta fold hydrolase n=1 Tax=Streptomyces sp. XD-27 TaxID=3062779 RepID=UPI0026F43DDA|nr:alpha/beta fold hydrolase [Streptomyces sp. XD-27]WKX73559.1 alpha/beta fold hydrolase [Streptomyces sp. XD-27]